MENWRVFEARMVVNCQRYVLKKQYKSRVSLISSSGGGVVVKQPRFMSSISIRAAGLGNFGLNFFATQRSFMTSTVEQQREVKVYLGPSPSPILMVPSSVIHEIDLHKLIQEDATAEIISQKTRSSDDDYPLFFFSLAEKKMFKIKKNKSGPVLGFQRQRKTIFPFPYGVVDNLGDLCVGSSHGWLALINRSTCALYLFNPLFSYTIFPTSTSNTNMPPFIPLPPIETFSSSIIMSTVHCDSSTGSNHVIEFQCNDRISAISSKYLSEEIITKLVLSIDPSLPSSPSSSPCTVVAISSFSTTSLSFWRIGDKVWTPLHAKSCISYADVIYSSKDRHFYTLRSDGSVEAWDLHREDPSVSLTNCGTVMKSPSLPPVIQLSMDWKQRELRIHCIRDYYLAESLEGDLLVAVRFSKRTRADDSHTDSDTPSPREDSVEKKITILKTLAFDVYKPDFAENKWVFVPSLGDHHALFVGDLNHSLSLSTQDFPRGGLKGNSIYFSFKGDDLGVFNLEDQTVTPFFLRQDQQIHPFPVWLLPKKYKTDRVI